MNENRIGKSRNGKSRNGFAVMCRLIGLVKPLTGYMLLAITMGLTGHLCASFLTIFGGYAVLIGQFLQR